MRAVLAEADAAACELVRGRRLCIMITLDVPNAFDSAPWRLIVAALKRRGTPLYLRLMIRSYLSERSLLVYQDGISVKRPMLCGVPQG